MTDKINQTRQALVNAAEWFKSNPDKLIAGNLAIAQNGLICLPTAEDAECFCAVGRVARELGITPPPKRYHASVVIYDVVDQYLSPLGWTSSAIFSINDKAVRRERELRVDAEETAAEAVYTMLMGIAAGPVFDFQHTGGWN